MTKKIQVLVLLCIVAALLALLYVHGKEKAQAPTTIDTVTTDKAGNSTSDYKNISYSIEGELVTLVDGYAETEIIPGSASKKITRYFGNELQTDLDGDGDEDIVFIVSQETGGSGTFFYAVAALKTDSGYVGSDGYFLGDRIAPQSTTLSQNPTHKYVVVFNYAVHGPEQGLSEQPTLGKSTYLKIVPETNQWAVVEPDFEGESRE